MNVASLELSQQLYELSGWRNTTNTFGSSRERLDWIQTDNGKGWYLPAYDLGYLLRRIPGYCHLEHSAETGKMLWMAYHSEQNTQYAETPEDAVAKMCIELFKQGILKPEESA